MNREQRRHNGHGPSLPSVPILNQVKVQRFICKVGHTYDAPEAWRFALGSLTSLAACPICFVHFVSVTFPAWPEGMTMEMAVEQGLLHKAVLPKEKDG